MKRYIGIAAALMLAGCSGVSGCSAIQTANDNTLAAVEYGCASASTGLKVAIVLFDKLTPAQRNTITQAKTVVDPICLQTNVPTLTSTAMAAFTAATTQITATAAAVAK